MSRDGVAEAVAEYFRGREDIAAVYLFGSRALGKARPDSDVDVGLLYREAPQRTLLGMPFGDEAELGDQLGLPVQLIVMNDAPVELVHQILLAECLLLDKCPSLRVQFEVKRRNEYWDLKPVLDLYRREVG